MTLDVSQVCDEATHAAIKRDDAAWAALEQLGTMPTYDDEPGAAQVIEIRNCRCGSSLAREVRS